jgi:hypothetical protein
MTNFPCFATLLVLSCELVGLGRAGTELVGPGRAGTKLGGSAIASEPSPPAKGMLATASASELAIESRGGPVTYKLVVDRKTGGSIKQLCLPAAGPPVANDLNDLFFFGAHQPDFTLRGWTARDNCTLSCSADIVSQTAAEVVVRAKVVAAGTFKILAADADTKARLRANLKNYHERTVAITRLYSFQPDRVVMNDEVSWIYPHSQFTKIEWTASFLPGCVQSPVRLVKGSVAASFYPVGSGGEKIPNGITYPFTAVNFLKNGWKASLRTAAASFDLGKSNLYFYEKPWQQDWCQVSGFAYDIAGHAAERPVSVTHELVFAKAAAREMPPVITIHSPGPGARWMDEKGEVAQCKLGDVVKLVASAVNADGSPVPDKDISWDVRIEAWWKRRPMILQGREGTVKLLPAANEEEVAEAGKHRLLAVIKVTARGNNGAEATEHFAMLVGKADGR